MHLLVSSLFLHILACSSLQQNTDIITVNEKDISRKIFPKTLNSALLGKLSSIFDDSCHLNIIIS